MLLTEGTTRFCWKQSMKVCLCGLSAGVSWLFGRKGLGGGPDETEKLSFSFLF